MVSRCVGKIDTSTGSTGLFFCCCPNTGKHFRKVVLKELLIFAYLDRYYRRHEFTARNFLQTLWAEPRTERDTVHKCLGWFGNVLSALYSPNLHQCYFAAPYNTQYHHHPNHRQWNSLCCGKVLQVSSVFRWERKGRTSWIRLHRQKVEKVLGCLLHNNTT